jgi:hypothetical protein
LGIFGIGDARGKGFNSMYGMNSMQTSYLVPLFLIGVRKFCKICKFNTLVLPFTVKKCSGCGNNYD